MMRALAIVALTAAAVAAQVPVDPKVEAQLRQLFPSASSFSPKEGDPPHFKAFTRDPRSGAPALAGLAFWTTELDPLERGYDGPIRILVGMDTSGVLVGILVVDHREPYGHFSVDTQEFAAQFKGKSVRASFSVGEDIDAISRATMSVSSAARAIRNSARRVATRLLKPPGNPQN